MDGLSVSPKVNYQITNYQRLIFNIITCVNRVCKHMVTNIQNKGTLIPNQYCLFDQSPVEMITQRNITLRKQ